MNAIQKVLVPTDFSAHSDEAFRAAHVLARATGAAVVVFHVAHPPAVASEGGPLMAEKGNGQMADVWDRFKNYQATDPAVRVEHVVIVAERPRTAHILEVLDKTGCDLIVMGTYGRSRLNNLLFGSTTEEVIRRAHCPVMVVKAPASKASARPPRVAAKSENGQPRKL